MAEWRKWATLLREKERLAVDGMRGERKVYDLCFTHFLFAVLQEGKERLADSPIHNITIPPTTIR
jgi:hypothetical protein